MHGDIPLYHTLSVLHAVVKFLLHRVINFYYGADSVYHFQVVKLRENLRSHTLGRSRFDSCGQSFETVNDTFHQVSIKAEMKKSKSCFKISGLFR